jgi:hypothetical protein
MGVCGQRHASTALYPGKGSPVPTGQEAGWAPEQFWTQRLEEFSFVSAGIELPRPVYSEILYWQGALFYK